MKRVSAVARRVTDRYLAVRTFTGEPARDFNGVPARELWSNSKRGRAAAARAISSRELDLTFGERHHNPAIKALPSLEVERQLSLVEEDAFERAWAYPTPELLERLVDPQDFASEPYALRLALGGAQLEPAYFDPAVLETYFHDPRYAFKHNDVQGTISIRDPFYSSDDTKESDKILLQSFGFGFDEKLNRVVAAYLRYLANLSPEHQQIWAAREVRGAYFEHPDYRRTTYGEWPERVSLFDALVAELRVINQMCQAMGKPPLFRKDLEGDRRPRELSYMLRPTKKAFDAFVHTLDKVLSDNLNHDFFKGEVPLETEVTRPDGRVEVQRKGTIALLEEFLRARFRSREADPMNAIFPALKKVRKLRQSPAHSLGEDSFEPSLLSEQRDLIGEAYGAIRTVRLIFANHPAAKGIEVPDWLYEARIWPF